MISAEPAMRHASRWPTLAASDAGAARRCCDGDMAADGDAVARASRSCSASYDAYLAKFGDRCLEELKLESATLHDDPLLLAAGGRARGARGVARPSARGRQRRAVVTAMRHARRRRARVATALGGRPLRALLFGWVLRARRGARSRPREPALRADAPVRPRAAHLRRARASATPPSDCSTTRATSSTWKVDEVARLRRRHRGQHRPARAGAAAEGRVRRATASCRRAGRPLRDARHGPRGPRLHRAVRASNVHA